MDGAGGAKRSRAASAPAFPAPCRAT